MLVHRMADVDRQEEASAILTNVYPPSQTVQNIFHNV